MNAALEEYKDVQDFISSIYSMFTDKAECNCHIVDTIWN
jgi:hypothetical protein